MPVISFRDAVGSRLAYEYLKRKIALIRIAPQSKRPLEKDWTTRFYTDLEAASVFVDHNIGAVLGRASGWLTDIDLDCPEAVQLARYILPPTPWVFGRKSAPKSHYMYLVRDSKTVKFQSPLKDGGMLLEIRSDGAQTVMPGSVHTSGESINFYDDGWKQYRPYDVPVHELQQRCADLAAAVIVLRHGWGHGKRDELAVALCGLMLRIKRDPDYIDQWLGAIANAAGDEELDMRLKAEYQAKRLEANEKVPGIPSLMNILGSDLGTRVIDWLGVRQLSLVHELNQEVAVISLGEKTRVLVDSGYWNIGPPKFMRVTDARTLFQNRGSVKEGKHYKLKFDVWLNASERRNYNSLVFAPDGCKDFEYNLWKGWPIGAQNDPDGCSMFLKHMREVICSGDDDLYDYIINWLADAVQNITKRPGVALVMQGFQGTGKSMFCEYILRMYGKYGITSTNSEYLFGKHNFHLANKLMVFADESCWAGNRHHAAVLNNMITSGTLGFEPKGVDLMVMENFMRLMMATNDTWAVPATGSARRFCVVEVSDARKGDKKYFEKLAFEMDNDGPESLLGYLQEYKLTRNLRNIPATRAIVDNKMLTIAHNNPMLAWWIQKLADGCQTRSQDNWTSEIGVDTLFRDYESYAKSGRDKSNMTSFGMILRGFFPQGSLTTVKRRVAGQLRRFYQMPTLPVCKEYVADHLLNEPNLFEKLENNG